MFKNRHTNPYHTSLRGLDLCRIVISVVKVPRKALKNSLILSFLVFISCNQDKPKTETHDHLGLNKEYSSIQQGSRDSVIEFDIRETVQQDTDFYFTDNSFKTFYERFIQDSLFQIERVRFPLRGQYESFDGERKWSKKKWSFMNWDFRENMYDGDDSTYIIQDSCKFFYGVYCRECGFSFEMEFQKLNDKWFLTYRQENNY